MVYTQERRAKHTPRRKAWKCVASSGPPRDNLTIDDVEIVNQWQRRKTAQQRTNSREAFAQERKTKVIERRERCVKQEEAIGRKLALVAQEIKAEQEPHYHDNEKQRKSDNVTDIHDWSNSRAY
jgi:hypothetical protein